MNVVLLFGLFNCLVVCLCVSGWLGLLRKCLNGL